MSCRSVTTAKPLIERYQISGSKKGEIVDTDRAERLRKIDDIEEHYEAAAAARRTGQL